MQACSTSSLSGHRTLSAGSACPAHPYLRPLRLPANRCFVSRRVQGAALTTRSTTRLNVSATATLSQANPLSLLGSASGDVFVAGATGPLGARITQELLLAGFKVTAGAADIEEAQGLLDFARRFELIRKEQSQKLSLAEVDFSDEDDIAASIPRRGAKVVIALGDAAGRQRIDARVASRIVEAAQAAGASQLVLVAPSGAGGGGGLFGGFLGGGGSSSAVEQEVVNSGIQCVVLRTGATNVDESSAVQSGISLGIQGSKPSNASISKSQVAQVVAQALRQADTDVALEAWADRSAAPRDLAQLMAEVLPLATIEGAEEEEKEEEEEDEPEPLAAVSSAADKAAGSDAAQEARQAAGGLFGRAKRTAQEVSGEEEPEEKPKTALGGLFGRAKRTAQEVTGEEEPEEKPKAALGGLFGRAKKAAQEATGEAQPEKKPAKAAGGLFGRARKATEEAIDEIESEPKPRPFAALLGGTRKVSVEAQQRTKQAGRQAASAGKRAARETQSAAQQAAPRRSGVFGRATPPAAEEPAEDTNPLSQLFGGGKRAAKEAEKGSKQVRVSAQQAQKNVKQSAAKLRSTAGNAAASAESEKKAGPLSWLGIGQDTVYADDD